MVLTPAVFTSTTSTTIFAVNSNVPSEQHFLIPLFATAPIYF